MSAVDISLDCILVQNTKQGIITAFIKQMPNIFAEGGTPDEAIENLMNALHDVFKHKSKKRIEKISDSINVIHKPIHLTTSDCFCVQ